MKAACGIFGHAAPDSKFDFVRRQRPSRLMTGAHMVSIPAGLLSSPTLVQRLMRIGAPRAVSPAAAIHAALGRFLPRCHRVEGPHRYVPACQSSLSLAATLVMCCGCPTALLSTAACDAFQAVYVHVQRPAFITSGLSLPAWDHYRGILTSAAPTACFAPSRVFTITFDPTRWQRVSLGI